MSNVQIMPVNVPAKNVKAQSLELKVPLYSRGCESKIKKALSSIRGIYSVVADLANQKVTVVGIMDGDEVLSAVKSKRRDACYWNQRFCPSPSSSFIYKPSPSNRKENTNPNPATSKGNPKPTPPSAPKATTPPKPLKDIKKPNAPNPPSPAKVTTPPKPKPLKDNKKPNGVPNPPKASMDNKKPNAKKNPKPPGPNPNKQNKNKKKNAKGEQSGSKAGN